jgi:hypothetical protein
MTCRSKSPASKTEAGAPSVLVMVLRDDEVPALGAVEHFGWLTEFVRAIRRTDHAILDAVV